MNIFTGKSLFQGYKPIITEELLLENNQSATKDTISEIFAQFGIQEAEQLLFIANTEDRKILLADSVGVSTGFVQHLIDKCTSELGENARHYTGQGPIRPTGLQLINTTLITEGFQDSNFRVVPTGDITLDQRSQKLAEALGAHDQVSGSKSFLNIIPRGVKDQGEHPTCAAFAATASNEFRMAFIVNRLLRGFRNLSESSIFCEAKKTDGIPYERGTTLIALAEVIGRTGQAQEIFYPYDPSAIVLCEAHDKKQTISVDRANHRAGIISLNPKSVKALKSALDHQHLPYIGIELFESAWNLRTNENGYITMPLKGEASQGGHVVCLVGYFDDPDLPGGGTFILKNSWGTSWSFNNVIGRQGFGFVSYGYIENYCNQAYLTV